MWFVSLAIDMNIEILFKMEILDLYTVLQSVTLNSL